jgi:23S rRNA pseudouridine2457 synthase
LFKYYVIYKPFGMLSQFTKEGDHTTLGELFDFPKDVYPVGRLDADSEGLLVITNDKRLNNRLLDPILKHDRTYYAQVEGQVTDVALAQLRAGTEINISGKVYKTIPAKAEEVIHPELPERNPPIRYRKNIPTSWIKLVLVEGKNRQVRKMTASVGFPTLRLVRVQIGKLAMKGMQPGDVVEYNEPNIYKLLGVSQKSK